MKRLSNLVSRFTPRAVRAANVALTALLLALAPLRAQEDPAFAPGQMLEWLRSLALEGRLASAQADPDTPRLFVETFPDGRTWFRTIADDLGTSGDWALLDDAIAVCLAEADRMKELAEARAGTPAEATINTTRKLYLEGAGKLLGFYRTAAGDAFEDHAGGLVGVTAVPDWAMPLLNPGEIHLREIAGAGRLNVETLAFSGRLSGLLELPGLQTTLAVPNFSFDSLGNVDLTAFGQTFFPPNDPDGLLLTIPPRRPLLVHLADDGDFRVAGGVRVGFPGGNVVEAFFDVDDPKYAFGFAFSGGLTLELAREMTVILPVINFDVVNRQSLAALDGFSRFYGNLGQGIETFLDESPELPSIDDLDVGVPPEFEVPETVVPFDVIDAWIVAVGNDFVRPAVNGSFDATLGAIREMLANLKSDIAAARTQNAPTLAQMQRLRRIARINGDLKNLLDLAAAAQTLGVDLPTFVTQSQEAADEAVAVATEYLENTPPDANLKSGFAAIRLLLNTEATAQATGAGLGLDLPLTFTKLDQWSAAALAPFGFNGDGSVADPARVAALSRDDLRVLVLTSYELDAMREGLGGTSANLAPIFARLEFERTRDAYNAAVSTGDLETRAVQAQLLLDLASAQGAVGFTASDAELVFMVMALQDTFEAIANRGSGGPDGQKLATAFLEAARRLVEAQNDRILRRKAEMFGETDPKPDFADTLDFSFYEFSFFEKLHAGIQALLNQGLLDAALQGRLEGNVAGFLRFYRQALAAEFTDAELVTQSLEGALEALGGFVDAIAFLEDFLPAQGPLLGEFQASWEALHIQWTGIAEAQKAHWLLAAYLREIVEAADRYGNGVSGALRAAFEENGTEAAAGLSDAVEALAGLLDAIDEEKFTFPLPGDIEIQRLFGELAFDRSIPDWEVAFGGRVVFPEINALFELTSATLASDGSFSLAMRAEDDTAFGLSEDFALALAIPGAGGTPFTGQLPFPDNGFTSRLDGFSGQGLLTHRLGGGVTETYNVSVDYLALDPGHRFAVRTVFAGQRELFTPEIMLFEGAVGFNLETTLSGQPTQGGAEVGLGIGFLLRPGATPDPVQRTPADYFLNFAGEARLDFSLVENSIEITLVSGALTLPPELFAGPGDTPPTITLLSPICVRVDFDDPDGLLSWCDVNGDPVRIAIDNLGFKLPGVPGAEATAVSSDPDPAEVPDPANEIPGFQAGVSAVLLFRDSEFPVIERITATLVLPFPGNDASDPGQNRLVSFAITGTNWRLDGLPDSVAIELLTDLHVVDYESFDLFILAGTDFGLERIQVGNEQRVRFTIEGAIRGEIAGEILAEDDPDGGNFKFGGGAGGSFSWDFVDPPQFTLDSLQFSGAMKLGGDNGLELVGVDSNGIPDPGATASIELSGLDNLFSLSPATPFEIKVNGAIGVAGVIFFGFKDARVIFDGIAEAPPGNTEPQFRVSAIGFREGEDAVELLGLEELPARLTAGSVAFDNDALPFPDLLALDNLIFTVSGVVDLRLGESEDAPRLFGAVEDLQIAFPDGFEGFPTFSLDTLALALENLTIGDMAGLSGGLVVGNLNDPPNLFFGGVVGGGYNGVGIKALVATRLDGLIGLCLKVNAGPVGIPLDGGTLGGIMLTGASGGVFFGNTFANPCEFSEILGLDPDTGEPSPSPAPARKKLGGEPGLAIAELDVVTWKELAEYNELHGHLKEWRDHHAKNGPPAPAASPPDDPDFAPLPRAPRKGPAQIPCPTGDCPPSTINLLCQRHPSFGEEPSDANYDREFAERIIYKFTSLDRDTVDEILDLAGIDLAGATPESVGIDFAQGVRDLIDSLIPRPGTGVPNATELNQAIDDALAIIQGGLQTAVTAALNAVTGGESLLDALYKAAYAGIPCLDVTILLDGTFTWTPVSAALSATGGAVVSTTGSSGIFGSINLMGIPVGTAEFFFSYTDADGLPNPSFCGFIRAALGPLQLGRMDMALECPGCVTGVIEALANFVTNLTGDLATNADPILRQLIADALGVEVATLTGPLPSFFGPGGSLDQEQQVAVLAALLNLPDLVRFLEANPELPAQFSVAVLRDLGEASIDLLLDIYAALDPRFTFCGEVEPKLFGFSLTGGNTLVAAQLFADKTRVSGGVSFSPSYIFGNLPFFILSGGTINNVVPALDQGDMGFSIGAPTFDRPTFDLMTSQPLVYAEQQLNAFLSNAQLTFGYELSPFGFKIADGEGRVILPTVADHPDNEFRPGGFPFQIPTEPSRDEVLKAALDANLLAQALWQGKGTELEDLFRDGSPEEAGAVGRELARDYFPRGGFIGAAKLQLPRPITDFPPVADLNTLFGPDSDLGTRFTAAESILNDYLLSSDEVGQLTMYVSFPSPPAAFWTGTQKPAEFLDQIAALDIEALAGDPLNLFPEFFLRGDMQLDILGMPLAEGELVADPALGLFLFRTSVPSESWLHNFVQGNVEVKIATAEYIAATDPNNLPPGETPESLDPLARLQAAFDAIASASTPAEQEAALALLGTRLTDTLPKASMEASLGVNLNDAFAAAGLGDFVRFNAGAGFFAFSPRFDPDYPVGTQPGEIRFPDPDPNDPGPYTLARRNGGFVAGGNFNFGFNLNDPNPNNRLVINIPEVALGITGGTENPLPNLAGRALIDEIALPGFPRLTDGLFAFNSNPGPTESLIRLEGDLEPFAVRLPLTRREFITFTALPPATTLGGALRITPTAAAFEINPATVQVPMLGKLTGRAYGKKTPKPGIPNPDPCNSDHFDFTNFTFSSVPGQPWHATLDLCGALEIRSPLDPNPAGPVLFRAEPLTSGGQPIPFVCELDGVGLDSFELKLQIPNGVTLTFFPGTAHQSSFTFGSPSATCLLINSEGRVYFDGGTQDLKLALPTLGAGGINPNGLPLAEIRGRLQFGFEPVDTTPRISATPANLSFTTSLGNSLTQNVTVTNTNRDASRLEVDASLSNSTHFEITPSRFLLGGGESRNLTVRFTPRTIGTKNANLTLTHNTPSLAVVIPLTGNVTTAPKIHLTTAAINFGLTPLATPKSQIVTVTNTGTSNLTLSSIVTSAGPFSDDRSSTVIAPNASSAIAVTFTPTGTAAATGTLTINTNDPVTPVSVVTLTGTGSDRFWYRQRKGRGDFALHDVAFFPDSTDGDEGFAAGEFGAYFQGRAAGQIWSREPQDGNLDFRAVVKVDDQLGWLAGTAIATKGNTLTRLGRAFKTTNGGSTWTSITDTDVTGGGASGSTLQWNDATVIGASTNLALAGELNGQGRIAIQNGATSFFTATLRPTGQPRLNGIVLGANKVAFAVGDDLTILKSTDDGTSWDRLTNLPVLPAGLDFNAVALNPLSTNNFIVVGDGGTILRTADAGASWTVGVSNTTADLYGVVRAGGSRFFAVGDNGTIVRGSSTGSAAWTVEDAQTNENFRSITASREGASTVGNEVWAVTTDGSIFHRRFTAINGPITVVTIDESLDVGEVGVGERVVREVRVANEGVANLASTLVPTGGNASLFEVIEDPFLNSDGDSKTPLTIPPRCEGVYYVVFEHNSGGAFATTLDLTAGDGSKADQLDPQIVLINRDPDFSELGHLTAPACLDLGAIAVGSGGGSSIKLGNVGEAPITIHGFEARHDRDDVLFDFSEGPGFQIPPGATVEVTINVSTPNAVPPGDYRGLLEISSDARNGVAVVEVVGRIVQPQEVVIVTTNVPGATVQVDHDDNGSLTSFASPAVFTLVDGVPANTAQIQRGDVIDVSTLASFTRTGVNYGFQRWTPGGSPPSRVLSADPPRSFSFTADGETRLFTALFASSPPPGPRVTDPPFVAAPRPFECRMERPADVAFGPWVRITQARLRLPWLGDGAGSDFQVDGALFLSLARATGSLTSSRIVAKVPAEFGAPFAGFELLEVTPGSWNFDIRSTGEAEFHSLTPGLRILNTSALPPTALDLEIDLNASDLQRRAFVRFATLDELPLLPGVLALGPGSAEFETALAPGQLVFRMDVGGSIRMLANPDSPGGWMINHPVGVEFDANIGIRPFVFPNSAQIADVGLFRLFSRAGQTSIGPEFDGVNLTLAARNFQLDILRSPERINLNEIAVDSTGTFAFNAALAGGITLGPVRLVPQSTAGANDDATIVANPFQALLQVNLPAIFINSSSGRWKEGEVDFNPPPFDSTNFSFRTELPTIDFDDVIALKKRDRDSDNFFEFRRNGNDTSLKLRNRQELFIGGMKIKFDVSNNNGVSGTVAGRMGLEGPEPLNRFQDYISMTYDSSPSSGHAHFELNRYFLGLACRLRFGGISPLAQGCTLTDKSPDPIESWPVFFCAP